MKATLRRILPGNVKAAIRRSRGALQAWLAQRTNLTREPFSYIFLKGEGIEIGPLNYPLAVSGRARVKYVDRMPREDLLRYYTDVDPKTVPQVDIVTDGETLPDVADDSVDFVISNHMVEHCQDPVGTIRHFLRVLRVEGILFLTLPDKRFTFDVDRPVSHFEHVKKDYLEGPMQSRREHYVDWLRFVKKVTDEGEFQRQLADLESADDNIHFHAWTQAEMIEMMAGMQIALGFPFDIEAISKTGLEVIFILKKTGPVPPAPR